MKKIVRKLALGVALLAVVRMACADSVAKWVATAPGELTQAANWAPMSPGPDVRAVLGAGTATHTDAKAVFAFTNSFVVGRGAGKTGFVSLSASDGVRIEGSAESSLIVGTDGGTGVVDVVNGQVNLRGGSSAYGALTVGGSADATGLVSVRGGRLNATGDVFVGVAGTGTLEVVEGVVKVSGDVSVGPSGAVTVSGGRLEAVSGSVCGGTVEVDGGVLTAATVCVGSDLQSDDDTAVLRLRSGRVETAGFTAGTRGGRAVSLAGGTLVPTQANDDFFAGIDAVDLAGDLTVSNAQDVTICSKVSGMGGLIKTGDGVLKVSGLAAWTRQTTVLSGALDLSGSMVIGALSVAPGAELRNAKFDDFENVPTTATDWFAVSFDDVTSGTSLASDTGVQYGGAWATVPASATAITADGGRLSVDTSAASGDVSFAATASSSAPYAQLDFVLYATGAASPFELDAADKGALMVLQEEEGGEMVYIGYTALGWLKLYRADGTAPAENDRIDARMAFDFSQGRNYVSYLVKVGTDYERLATEDGVDVFPAAGDATPVSTLAFRGQGQCGAFSSRQFAVQESDVFYWIGGDGDWSDGSKWSHDRATGTPAGVAPGAGQTAFVEKSCTLNLAESVSVDALVVNADVSLAGDGALCFAKSVAGAGNLTLDGATLRATAEGAVLSVALAPGATAAVEYGAGAQLEVTGAWTGTGTLTVGPASGVVSGGISLSGALDGFAGTLNLAGNVSVATPTASSSVACWRVAEDGTTPFFGADSSTYGFGSLCATFGTGRWTADDVTVRVGSAFRDEASCVRGVCAGANGVLESAASSAVVTNGVSGLSRIVLSGGGALVIERAEAVPTETVAFMSEGGTLALLPEVDVDVSGLLTDSEAAVAFDDGGVDRTWSVAFSASNAGGFVKRGSGTLVWAEVPENEGVDVTVEAGRLIVPFGTRLGRVTLGDEASIAVDLTDATDDCIAFSVERCNRTLEEPCFALLNKPANYDCTLAVNSLGGVFVVNGSRTCVWTGAAGDGLWSTAGNWSVDGVSASTEPGELDRVVFTSDAETHVILNHRATVLSVSAYAGLRLEGARPLKVLVGFALYDDRESAGATALADRLGDLTLDGAELTVLGAPVLRTVSGNGKLIVNGDDLTLWVPDKETLTFSGTLGAERLVKTGAGTFAFTGAAKLEKGISLQEGTLIFGAAGSSDWSVDMAAGTDLDLNRSEASDTTFVVGSFSGAGVVHGGLLVPACGKIVQSGGELTVPAVEGMTYVAYRAGNRLIVTGAEETDTAVTIVVPSSWFAAGASGKRMVFCDSTSVTWQIERRDVTRPINAGDGWWTLSGGGFTVRLR